MSGAGDTPIPEGTVVGGRYRIGACLGRGGMGEVYEATNTVTGKLVALKWLVPEQQANADVRRRLLREARIAARVHHGNVVDIYDVGEEGDAVFLVMELLEGEPLDDWIARHAPADPAVLLPLFVPVLRGLAALHAAGVVHRDLKPANVFVVKSELDPRPIPKLLDFGIARDRQTTSLAITRPGQILGTPAYMAPEQLDSPDEVDARADVYACGVILYEALAGERPYVSDSLKQLVGQILKGKPRPLHERRPELAPELSAIVMRAMHLEPSRRYQDVLELAEALEAHAGLAPVVVRRGRSMRTPILAGGFLAGAVFVGALASIDLGGDAREARPPERAAVETVPVAEPEPEPPPGRDPVDEAVEPPPAPAPAVEAPAPAEPEPVRDEDPAPVGRRRRPRPAEPAPVDPPVASPPPPTPPGGVALDRDDF